MFKFKFSKYLILKKKNFWQIILNKVKQYQINMIFPNLKLLLNHFPLLMVKLQ